MAVGAAPLPTTSILSMPRLTAVTVFPLIANGASIMATFIVALCAAGVVPTPPEELPPPQAAKNSIATAAALVFLSINSHPPQYARV